LPTTLTVEEVTRLIDAARTLTDRTMLMVLYSTGMRNAEMRSLQVQDIDALHLRMRASTVCVSATRLPAVSRRCAPLRNRRTRRTTSNDREG
jgi:site-specific recombinase XerD